MKKTLILSIKSLIAFSVICCVIYPITIWFLGQVMFNHQANGSLVKNKQGQVVGSSLIAQNFSMDQYFQPRPSYAGKKGYDATQSSGSNLGPTSASLMQTISERVSSYISTNMAHGEGLVPADAVMASSSGLDPHISVANAIHQSTRVATARKMDVNDVVKLIQEHTEWPFLGLFGEKRVNVLKINLALDAR